jgi:hypothetical protein
MCERTCVRVDECACARVPEEEPPPQNDASSPRLVAAYARMPEVTALVVPATCPRGLSPRLVPTQVGKVGKVGKAGARHTLSCPRPVPATCPHASGECGERGDPVPGYKYLGLLYWIPGISVYTGTGAGMTLFVGLPCLAAFERHRTPTRSRVHCSASSFLNLLAYLPTMKKHGTFYGIPDLIRP